MTLIISIHPTNQRTADRGTRDRPAAPREVDGAERAQEARGGGGGEARHPTNGNAGGGGAIVRIAGVGKRPDTELEQSQRRCVGGVYCCRRGGHCVRAYLKALFLMGEGGHVLDKLFIHWGWGACVGGMTYYLLHMHATYM